MAVILFFLYSVVILFFYFWFRGMESDRKSIIQRICFTLLVLSLINSIYVSPSVGADQGLRYLDLYPMSSESVDHLFHFSLFLSVGFLIGFVMSKSRDS